MLKKVSEIKLSIQLIFLIIIIPIGIVYMFFVIPGYVPDEIAHCAKAYDISKGNLFTKVNEETGTGTIYVPEDLLKQDINYTHSYSEMKSNFSKKTDYKTEVPYESAAVPYLFIMYIFPAISFCVCRVLNINILTAIFIGRFLNLIFYAFMGYLIIRTIPFGKKLMFLYLCLPMAIHQAIGITSDVFINTICLLFISYNFYIFKTDATITRKKKIIYYGLAILVGFSKCVYAPLILLSFMAIWSKKMSKKEKSIFIVSSILLVAITALLTLYISTLYKEGRPSVLERNVDLVEQVKFIIKNPLEYCKILKNTIFANAIKWPFMLLGYRLGPLTIKIHEIYIVIYLLLMFSTIFTENNKYELNGKEKIICALIFLTVFFATITVMYLVYSDVGEPIIKGVQGRYFIPVAILLGLMAIKKKALIKYKYINLLYAILIIVVNVMILTNVFSFFNK